MGFVIFCVLATGCTAGGGLGAAEPKEAVERLFAAAKHNDRDALTRLRAGPQQRAAAVACDSGATGRLAGAFTSPAEIQLADIAQVSRINIDGSTERNIRFQAGDAIDQGCRALQTLEVLDTQLVFEPRDSQRSPRASFVRLDGRWFILDLY